MWGRRRRRSGASTEGTSRRSATVPIRAARLALIAAVAWVGWTTAAAWSNLLTPAPTVDARPRQLLASPGPWLPSPLTAIGPGGSWTLGDMPGRLKIGRLEADEVAGWLGTPPAADPIGPPGDVERELIGLIRLLADRGRPSGSGAVYRINRSRLTAVAFTRGRGAAERLADVRVAWPAGGPGGGSLGIAIVPSEASAPPRAEDAAPLLPLPASARRLATRSDSNGRRMAEVFAVEARPTDLASLWGTAGWSLENLSVVEPGDRLVACRRGAESVNAWIAGAVATDSGAIVVLVRESGPSSDGSTR